MSQNTELKIVKCSDETLIEALAQVLDGLSEQWSDFKETITTNVHGISIPFSKGHGSALKDHAKENLYGIASVNGISFKTSAHGFLINFSFTRTNIEQLVDKVKLSYESNNLDEDLRKRAFQEFLRLIRSAFPIATGTEEVVSALHPEISQILKLTVSHGSRLEGIATKVIGNIAEQTEAWNSALIEQQEKLEARFEKQREELEKRQSEREASLEKAREQLEARQRELDDRSSRHVRRELLTKLEEIIERNREFELSEGTKKKFWPVFGSCCFGILIFGLASAYNSAFFYTVVLDKGVSGTNGWTFVYFLITMIASGGGAVGTFVYLIKFTSSWLQDHKRVELSNVKFNQDIVRASWIAELVFEWQAYLKEIDKDASTPFPPELLAHMSVNLFENDNAEDGLTHPIEQLLQTGKDFSKLKVGKGGLEIEKPTKTA